MFTRIILSFPVLEIRMFRSFGYGEGFFYDLPEGRRVGRKVT